MEDNLSQPRNGMKPVRIGIAGLSHDHVIWLLKRPARGDIDIVGIYEPDPALAQRYAGRYNFDPRLLLNTLEGMLEAVRPEAVVAFGSIYDHLATVEACAPSLRELEPHSRP